MSDAHLLPPSATHAEVGLSRATARLADVPSQCRQMWNPATCPPAHLPWLAWAFSVDEWDSGWTDTQRRAVINASYTVHRHKGTVGAVRRALAALGYDTSLSEWFQWSPGGEPYTFGEIGDSGLPPTMYDDIEPVALATKNVRSHLAWIRLRPSKMHGVLPGAAAHLAYAAAVDQMSAQHCEDRITVALAGRRKGFGVHAASMPERASCGVDEPRRPLSARSGHTPNNRRRRNCRRFQ